MDIQYNHEKILIIVALVLCAGIMFYNAFFVPDISIPSVIYIDPENSSENINSDSELSYNTIDDNDEITADTTKVNINTATETELSEKLTGVGPSTAKKIIEYRENVGVFSSIEDIKNIDGIGDKTFEKFKDMICV